MDVQLNDASGGQFPERPVVGKKTQKAAFGDVGGGKRSERACREYWILRFRIGLGMSLWSTEYSYHVMTSYYYYYYYYCMALAEHIHI